MRTLKELWDAGHTSPPPPTLVRELVAMPAFMASVKQLGAKYAAAQAFFVQAAAQAEEARRAKAAAELAAEEKARGAYVAEAAKDRRRAHRAHLSAFKALPASVRRRVRFVMPGDAENDGSACWQCCGPFADACMDRAVTLAAGEERTPYSKAALPGFAAEDLYLPAAGDIVSYCVECYEERCEALGIEIEDSDDEYGHDDSLYNRG